LREDLLGSLEIGKPLPPAVRSAVRVSYGLRRVPASRWHMLLPRRDPPQVGDVALARVEAVGKNTALDLASGRRCKLHSGDLIGVVFGHRYATLQFEGYARSDGDHCDLLSGGGLCGLVASKHDTMPDPTRLRIEGALGDERGQPLRLQNFTVRERSSTGLKRPKVAVVLGTSMDSGKTHTALSVIQGLERRGVAVAGIKLTGTAAGTDTLAMLDAGACVALDFVDGGLPSTFRCTVGDLLDLYRLLLDHAAAQSAEWAVVEIADGVIQGETAALLASTRFLSTVEAWFLAANDALGALGAVGLLRPKGIVPLAISGMVSRSALARREVETATGIPCVAAAELQAGALNARLLAAAPPRGLRAVSGEYPAIWAAE
jgi:hypothetical protein